MFNQEQSKAYQRDGFLLINKLFDQEEIGLLSSAAKQDHELERRSRRKRDSQGGTVRLSLWNHPGDTIYGMFARCHRIVNSMEVLLDGEVYHYHSKMILKDPEIGGAWEWHQDYGYWYQNGCLQPRETDAYRSCGNHIIWDDLITSKQETKLALTWSVSRKP